MSENRWYDSDFATGLIGVLIILAFTVPMALAATCSCDDPKPAAVEAPKEGK